MHGNPASNFLYFQSRFFNANTEAHRVQHSLIILTQLYQQAMHRGTHDAHFPIFRFRENREIACWW